MMDNRQIIGKLRDCAKGLLDVARELQRAERVESPRTLEIVKRLRMFASARCRNISEFNSRKQIIDKADDLPRTVPYIVAVFDELSDLMWKAGKEIEPLVCRMTAIARAAGVHLVIATGRPDAKVITGAIKVNLRGRIAFLTASSIDSLSIIDDKGAENLLGGGDFILRTGLTEIVRGQGAYVSDAEMSALVSAAVEKYGQPKYVDEMR